MTYKSHEIEPDGTPKFEENSPFFFRHIILHCVKADPQRRPSAEAIDQDFELLDSFFTKLITKFEIPYDKMDINAKNSVFKSIYRGHYFGEDIKIRIRSTS